MHNNIRVRVRVRCDSGSGLTLGWWHDPFGDRSSQHEPIVQQYISISQITSLIRSRSMFHLSRNVRRNGRAVFIDRKRRCHRSRQPLYLWKKLHDMMFAHRQVPQSETPEAHLEQRGYLVGIPLSPYVVSNTRAQSRQLFSAVQISGGHVFLRQSPSSLSALE